MVFQGRAIGAEHDSIGELVFTTGMVGYIETLTDPSYAGQMIMQTFPLVGNYGIIEEDFEGKCRARGYIVRECCDTPSNFRCQYELDRFLKDNNVPGIAGLDTRHLTRIIREQGVMNAKICSEIPEDMKEIQEYAVTGEVARVSCAEKIIHPAWGKKKHTVALIDYGAKENIVRALCRMGCEVTSYPCNSTAGEILCDDPDGIVLSNGPGDPAENSFCVEQIAKLMGKKPIFGICLGHQLAALAMGGRTVKLKYGHRGANQPVRVCGSHRCYITSQNHGYAVVSESIEGVGKVIFENANDGSCEGVEYPGKNCFTVQFQPEACSGSGDSDGLFTRFLNMMEGVK